MQLPAGSGRRGQGSAETWTGARSLWARELGWPVSWGMGRWTGGSFTARARRPLFILCWWRWPER